MPMVKVPNGWVNPEYVTRMRWTNRREVLLVTVSTGSEFGVRRSDDAERVEREIVAALADEIVVTGKIGFDPGSLLPVTTSP